jgi:hypothetical protein
MTDVRNALGVAGALVAFLALPAALMAGESGSTGAAEFFEKKVRPVLVEHCVKCHGADARKVKGGLRLDSRSALLRGGDGGPAVVPGEPSRSKLIGAVKYKDVDLQMPPKGKLSEAVIANLVTWVRDGAVWPDNQANSSVTRKDFDLAGRKAEHWCWQPVRRPAVPVVKNQSWPRSAADAFVLSKLEQRGLAPAQTADRRTLLRRVTFDLTGLPPTPEEIDAYLRDPSPAAYEKVVDRLLASSAYGERWARHWLDLVRYADTRGHEFDYPIPNAWQYRDYVIRAFNADVPYNQFVTEHLAGDLLAEPRRHPTEGFNESILGTGFWLLGEEVHSPVDIRQDLADRLDNRIDVLTKTFLGLTVACARCHDHKFDAISTRDYYALFGILEGASPRLVRFDSLEHDRAVAAELATSREAARPALSKALAADVARARVADCLLAAREAIAASPSSERELSPAKSNPGTFELGEVLRKRVSEIASARKLDPQVAIAWTAAVLAAGRDADDPLHAWAKVATDARAADPGRCAELMHSLAERVRRRETPTLADRAGMEVVIDYASPSAPWLPDGAAFGPAPVRPGSLLLGGRSGSEPRFAEERAAVYDRSFDCIRAAPGAEGEPGALGKRLRAGRVIRTPSFTVTTGKLYYRVRGAGTVYAAVEGHGLIAGPLHGQLLLDFRAGDEFRWVVHDLTPYKGRRAHVEFAPADASDLAVAQVVQAAREPADSRRPVRGLLELLSDPGPFSVEGVAARYERFFLARAAEIASQRPDEGSDNSGLARVANWFFSHTALTGGTAVRSTTAAAQADLARVASGIRKESRLAPALLDAAAADEHVFIRGSYKAEGESVPHRFLEALAGTAAFPAGRGSGRLELARQMTDPALDPLLARVLVNRVWHHLFGRGIVASTDNFGALGERPTHPELLDFLADEFVRGGWSVKAMVRSLVLSSTYRMDSRCEDAADAADPQDLLLHRMRLRRLEGEAIRDAVLAVSGRLDRREFGPAVSIHLTPFLDGRGRPASGPLDGDGRRSVYLAVRRNFLSPFLLAFDTPIPFSTVGRRTVSNVPAQALILLNDPFVQQQAGVWARQVLAHPGTGRERIEGMYVRAFGRPPAAAECASCEAFVREQAKLRGTAVNDPAPWSDLAHTLFNVKEFIFVR